MGYLINCKSDQRKLDDLNIRAHDYCVANVAGYMAIKWSDGITHPTTGELAFIVHDKIEPILTDPEKKEKIEFTQDWFPPM